MKKTYTTGFYKNLNTSIILGMLLSFSLIAVFIYLGRLYHSIMVGIWIPCFILVLPIFTGKQFKKKFTTKAVVGFDENNFTITQYGLASDIVTEEYSVSWIDIAAYRFYFDTKNTTSLTVYLKNNTKNLFIFLDNKSDEEALKQESVLSIFEAFVNSYNKEKTEFEKIKTRPGF